jgi:hypothetical protein
MRYLKINPCLNLLFGALCVSSSLSASAETPNILIVFTDDHGYADLGILKNDPDVRTPNVDRLAGEGVLFTRGYSTAPQCVPSRAGLVSPDGIRMRSAWRTTPTARSPATPTPSLNACVTRATSREPSASGILK